MNAYFSFAQLTVPSFHSHFSVTAVSLRSIFSLSLAAFFARCADRFVSFEGTALFEAQWGQKEIYGVSCVGVNLFAERLRAAIKRNR